MLPNLQKNVLVVEDDKDLAEGVSKLLKETYADLTIEVVYSMESADAALHKQDGNYVLVIMDVMLPKTQQDFENIRRHEIELDTMREKIRELSRNPKERDRLQEARNKRGVILKEIEDLVIHDGGIQLIEKWRNHAPHKVQQIPVLFLTAVGNDGDISRGATAAGEKYAWLVKPVSSDEILDKVSALLGNKVKSEGVL